MKSAFRELESAAAEIAQLEKAAAEISAVLSGSAGGVSVTSTATPARNPKDERTNNKPVSGGGDGERTDKKLVSGGGDVAEETVPDEDYYDYYSYYMVTFWLLP